MIPLPAIFAHPAQPLPRARAALALLLFGIFSAWSAPACGQEVERPRLPSDPRDSRAYREAADPFEHLQLIAGDIRRFVAEMGGAPAEDSEFSRALARLQRDDLPGHRSFGEEIYIDPVLPEGVVPIDGYLEEVPMLPNLPENKGGFFQKLMFTATWLDGGRADNIRLTELETFGRFALPLPTPEWPLLLHPGFNARLFEGPITPDVPARVYDAFLEFMWLPRITPRLTGILAVQPGLYTDFHNLDDDAFRIQGKGLLRFDWTPEKLQILAGLVYLDRDDFSLLPAGGIDWRPAPNRRYELIFPQPKLSWRIDATEKYEDWFYVAAQFGGNTWSVVREDLSHDRLTLFDLRALVGFEHRYKGGAGWRVEAGYVFGRELSYISSPDVFQLPNTLLVRGSIAF